MRHTGPVPAEVTGTEPERLPADQRRQALLDVAKDLVNESGPDAVTMGAVAERAEVTRALVYKHFDNKDTLLLELYRREASALDRGIRRQVEAADDGFEPKLRAFVRGCLDAAGEHGPFFAPLRSARTSDDARRQQRRWDRRTSGYFADLAAAEFGIEPATAATAIGVLFSGIQTLLSQLRRSPSAERRGELEAVYVEMTIGALERLARADG